HPPPQEERALEQRLSAVKQSKAGIDPADGGGEGRLDLWLAGELGRDLARAPVQDLAGRDGLASCLARIGGREDLFQELRHLHGLVPLTLDLVALPGE